MMSDILTIFTPTYNRAYALPRLYESLVNQTNRSFSWIIVDDGSTDNTSELVSEWIKENKCKIQYIHQPNGGKMRAHNNGVLHSNSELFLCVDSDDYIVDFAVERILQTWDNAKNSCKNEKIAGIVAYKGLGKEELIGNPMPNGHKFMTLSDLYDSGFSGDATIILRTEVFKEHLFPEIDGEKFITEGYVYEQIDQEYKLLLLRTIITICEYLPDGYSQNATKLYRDNPKGWALYFRQNALFAEGKLERFKSYIKYCGFSMLGHQKISFLGIDDKLSLLLAYPLGLLVVLKRLKEYKNLNLESK